MIGKSKMKQMFFWKKYSAVNEEYHIKRRILWYFKSGRYLATHLIFGSDRFQAMHTHPNGFWSFVYWGAYVNHTPDGFEQIRAPRLKRYTKEDIHRIRPVPGKACRTIILSDKGVPDADRIAFFVKGKRIEFTEYLRKWLKCVP